MADTKISDLTPKLLPGMADTMVIVDNDDGFNKG